MPLTSVGWTLVAFYGATALLAGILLVLAARAYRVTRDPLLITFLLAFALLEISSLFVLLNRLYGTTGESYHDTLWVHEVAQLGATSALASTFLLRVRDAGVGRTVATNLALGGVMAMALLLFFLAPRDLAFETRRTAAAYLYASGLLMLGLVVGVTATSVDRVRRDAWVPGGFALMAGGQLLWIAWALTDAPEALLGANGAFALGLLALVGAIRRQRREAAA